MIKRSGLILLTCLIPVHYLAIAQDPDAVIKDLKARYDKMEALQASFTQTTSSTFLDDIERVSGTILISADRYRVRTGSQTIVTDGVTVWVYNRQENQVLINDFVEDETAFSLTKFLSDFDSAYTVDAFSSDTVNEKTTYVIGLIPGDPDSMFERVVMRVRAADMTVTHLSILDLNETEMEVDLHDIRFNPEFSEQSFTFHIPAEVEVVDLRAE